jgi:hypothetical protein
MPRRGLWLTNVEAEDIIVVVANIRMCLVKTGILSTRSSQATKRSNHEETRYRRCDAIIIVNSAINQFTRLLNVPIH